jgi:hypothetical protein
MKTVIAVPAAALATALLLAASPAHALRVTAQASAVCQGALPAFETQIRKRPLAVQNEGTAAAFVTCSLNNAGSSSGTSRITQATVYLVNNNTGSRTLSCTGVSAAASPDPEPLYAVKSVQVPGGSDGTALSFTADDFPGESFALTGDAFSVSCSITPGTGIGGTVLLNNA